MGVQAEAECLGPGGHLVVPHLFRTIPSCFKGLERLRGVYRLEAGNLREAGTKLSVAEEQKGDGTRAQRGPASSGGTASSSRRCERRGGLKALAARANCAQLLSPGGLGPGALRQPYGRPLGPKPRVGTGRGHVRPAGLARSATPGRGATSRHARPSAHTPGARTPTARPRPPRSRLPRAPLPALAAPAAAFPIGRPASTWRPAPPLVSHSAEAALAGLVSSGDWQRRRRRAGARARG